MERGRMLVTRKAEVKARARAKASGGYPQRKKLC